MSRNTNIKLIFGVLIVFLSGVFLGYASRKLISMEEIAVLQKSIQEQNFSFVVPNDILTNEAFTEWLANASGTVRAQDAYSITIKNDSGAEAVLRLTSLSKARLEFQKENGDIEYTTIKPQDMVIGDQADAIVFFPDGKTEAKSINIFRPFR